MLNEVKSATGGEGQSPNSNELKPKSKLAKYLIGLVILCAVGYGMYYLKTQNSNVKTTTQNVSTAGWKTYKNNKYNYSIKYPSGYSIDEFDSPDLKDVGIIYGNMCSGTKFYGLRISIETVEPGVLSEQLPGNGMPNSVGVYYFHNKIYPDIYATIAKVRSCSKGQSVNSNIQTKSTPADDIEFDQILSNFKFID